MATSFVPVAIRIGTPAFHITTVLLYVLEPSPFHKMRKTVVQEAAERRVVLLTLDPWGPEVGWMHLPVLD